MASLVVSCNSHHVEVPFVVPSQLKTAGIAAAVVRIDDSLKGSVFIRRFVRCGARWKLNIECPAAWKQSSCAWMSVEILWVDVIREIKIRDIARVFVTDLPPIFLFEGIQCLCQWPRIVCEKVNSISSL